MPKSVSQMGQFARPPLYLAAGLMLLFLAFSQAGRSDSQLGGSGEVLSKERRVPAWAVISVFSTEKKDPVFDGSSR